MVGDEGVDCSLTTHAKVVDKVDRGNMQNESDAKSSGAHTTNPDGESHHGDISTQQTQECSYNSSSSSQSSIRSDPEHKICKKRYLQVQKTSEEVSKGSGKRLLGGMRADYIPVIAANAHDISFDVGNLQSRENSKKRINTIVVVPSIDLDATELTRLETAAEPYEERQLYHVLLLMKDPSFRVIFVTSHKVNPETIRYYLTLDGCNESELSERISRLFLLNPPDSNDTECGSLSQKIIRSELFINKIRNLVDEISNKEATQNTIGISYFCGSDTGDAVAQSLNYRLLEAQAKDQYFGCKQGSRELFRLCNIPCSQGTPGIGDEDLLSIPNNGFHWSENHAFICTPRNLAVGIARLIVYKKANPRKWVVKLNQGFSGKGNAFLDIPSIQNKMYTDIKGIPLEGFERVNAVANDIEKSFPSMKFVCKDLSWTHFVHQMSRLGAIAEAFVEGHCIASPSVQAVIDPDLEVGQRVQILSTHEQVLSGQIYIGCVNPAANYYRELIVGYTKRIGEELASHGVVGHFAADYLASTGSSCTGGNGRWEVTAIEINLRQGGTTHSYSTMATLCGGCTCSDGIFRTKAGKERYYKATDNYFDHRFIGLKPSTFLTEHLRNIGSTTANIQWNHEEKVGVVFHLLSLLPMGKLGFTAIGETRTHANQLYEETIQTLTEVAEMNL